MSTPGQNQKIVEELLRRLFVARDLESAFELLHPEFISHNPLVAHDPAVTSGKQAFVDYFLTPAGRRLASADSQINQILASEDRVVVFSRISWAEGPAVAAVDILRVQDELVIEHWDVVQPVPETTVNPHSMF